MPRLGRENLQIREGASPAARNIVGFFKTPLLEKFRNGGEGRSRTDAWSFCRALPYHLATPPMEDGYQYTLMGGVTMETCPPPTVVPSVWSRDSTMPSLKLTFNVPTGTFTYNVLA